MKNFNLNKGIKDFKKTGLSHVEKSEMLQRVLGKPASIPVESPFLISTYFSSMSLRTMAYALVVLVFVAGSVGTSYAAEKAVPGDILYPIKVNINEPLRSAVAVKKEAKAEWEAKKAERRLTEARILASEGKLNESKRKDIEAKFNLHSEKFSELSKESRNEGVEEDVENEDENNGPGNSNNPNKNKGRGSVNSAKNSEMHEKFEAEIELETEKLEHIKKSSNESQKKEIQELERNVKEKVKKVREDKSNSGNEKKGSVK
ncbi:MAG: DUF5667 domain-containing protein [Patescibacteria group bacterium]